MPDLNKAKTETAFWMASVNKKKKYLFPNFSTFIINI